MKLTQQQIGEHLNSKEKDTYLYIHEEEGAKECAFTMGGDMNTIAEILVDLMQEHKDIHNLIQMVTVLYLEREQQAQTIINQAKDNGIN